MPGIIDPGTFKMFSKIPPMNEKAKLVSKYFDAKKIKSLQPHVPTEYCEDGPSQIHDPDVPAGAGSKAPLKKPKKIKSLDGHPLKPPKTEAECQAYYQQCHSFLVESGENEESYNGTFDSAIEAVAASKLPKGFQEPNSMARVLSEEEVQEAKENARLDSLSEAELDAEERFGSLS